jgi:hypothetical protein
MLIGVLSSFCLWVGTSRDRSTIESGSTLAASTAALGLDHKPIGSGPTSGSAYSLAALNHLLSLDIALSLSSTPPRSHSSVLRPSWPTLHLPTITSRTRSQSCLCYCWCLWRRGMSARGSKLRKGQWRGMGRVRISRQWTHDSTTSLPRSERSTVVWLVFAGCVGGRCAGVWI